MKNTSKITVRLDVEQRAAEIELLTPHDRMRVDGLEHTFRKIGLRPIHTSEVWTPRYRVTRAKLREHDGSMLDSSRLVQLLRVIRERELDSNARAGGRAA